MDIADAARYGWDKKKSITMSLRSLTPEEFRVHSFLDDYLSDCSDPIIYHMNIRERINTDEKNGDLIISHGHEGESGAKSVSIDAFPVFKEKRGYKKFVMSMANHFGAEQGDVRLSEWGICDSFGNLWNTETVGHAEISDLADFFQKEFVEKNNIKAKTKIAVKYVKLTPVEIIRMTYDPKCVLEFEIE